LKVDVGDFPSSTGMTYEPEFRIRKTAFAGLGTSLPSRKNNIRIIVGITSFARIRATASPASTL
jgi:hypothetical protein